MSTVVIPATRRDEKLAYERNKLHKRLLRLAGQAIGDYGMIEAGDRVMVCLSGGKDSYALLDLLLTLRGRAPVAFDVVAVNLDQKQPGFPADVLPRYLESLGVPFHIENQDTYSIVTRVIPEGRTMCSLCSRLRRGILYRVARENGYNVLALAQHLDDLAESFLMSAFFGGKLRTMQAHYLNDAGDVRVIRPLVYARERQTRDFAARAALPVIFENCPACFSMPMQRFQMKNLLAAQEAAHPGLFASLLTAMRPLMALQSDAPPTGKTTGDAA